MNHCVPGWNFDADFPFINQKKPIGPDHELVELVWRNGEVVLQSQTQRKVSVGINESRQVQKHDQPVSMCTEAYGNLSSLTQDDETVSWIEYPLEDSFDKEFCSNFFVDLPPSDPIVVDEKIVNVSSSKQSNIRPFVAPEIPRNPMPPPRFQLSGKESGHLAQVEVREYSAMTVGSSHSGSNQVPNDPDFGRVSNSAVGTTTGLSAAPINYDLGKIIGQSERRQTETFEQTISSSSGGSGSSFGRTCKQSAGVSDNKRKGRDVEESECQSEDAELESASKNKSAKRPGSSRRSRAAEVHNLSERRRRDRINEKMKTLQELIPHSNKTDKASMLDEAIEYLKSLQLQLQVMWMGGGMAPMMYPGVQHYMSRMGQLPLYSMKNPLQFPRVPIINQSVSMAPTQNQPATYQNPVMNPTNYQNQMQNTSLPEQYARYMGSFHQMQTASQPINMFRFGSQTVQQSQAISSSGPFNGAPANANALGGQK